MKITVTRTINFNGQSVKESASADLPIALDHEDVAIRILVMRIALKQEILPMLPGSQSALSVSDKDWLAWKKKTEARIRAAQ